MNRTYRKRSSTGGRGISPNTSTKIWSRDKGLCIYCGRPAQLLDHVIPFSDNSPTVASNLVCCCYSCNSWRGKHPEDIELLTKAILWLNEHGENTDWMDTFYG